MAGVGQERSLGAAGLLGLNLGGGQRAARFYLDGHLAHDAPESHEPAGDDPRFAAHRVVFERGVRQAAARHDEVAKRPMRQHRAVQNGPGFGGGLQAALPGPAAQQRDVVRKRPAALRGRHHRQLQFAVHLPVPVGTDAQQRPEAGLALDGATQRDMGHPGEQQRRGNSAGQQQGGSPDPDAERHGRHHAREQPLVGKRIGNAGDRPEAAQPDRQAKMRRARKPGRGHEPAQQPAGERDRDGLRDRRRKCQAAIDDQRRSDQQCQPEDNCGTRHQGAKLTLDRRYQPVLHAAGTPWSLYLGGYEAEPAQCQTVAYMTMRVRAEF